MFYLSACIVQLESFCKETSNQDSISEWIADGETYGQLEHNLLFLCYYALKFSEVTLWIWHSVGNY